jgi:iron complex outermembrane receptor protein
LGSAYRPPNVIELLSDGVHQSAAAIEVGDINLKSEQSVKWITTLSTSTAQKKLNIEVSPYTNFIANYIFLQPEDAPRLTIRGAFPVFSYKQTNALISGVDFDAKYDIVRYLNFTHRTSFLYGRDISKNEDLIYMPPVNFSNTITLQSGKLKGIENLYFSINHIAVLTQQWYPEGVDFTNPPLGYQILNAYAGIDIPFKEQSITIIIQGENILNIAYRDYLNRFRYYADNMGRNFSIKIKYQFSHNPKNKQL